MEAMLMLLGIVVLAIPVAVIFLLIGQSGLRTRVAQLEIDLAALRSAGKSAPAPAAADTPRAAPAQRARKPDTKPEAQRPAQTPDQPAAARVVAAQRRREALASTTPAPPSPLAIFAQWIAVNWFYAVSALSLALAGLFLVQYGVENGLFPPAARVLAALGFGGALIAGGEVIRGRFGDGPEDATAYLPSVFSGAGLVSLFGGVAAARLLYDLIGVEAAFVGMAAVGLLGVVLGWLHGPLLATVGVVGAFAAPMLVGSTVPATSWLYVYFAIVTAVGLGIDTLRRWAWVSALSVAGGFVMGWLNVQGGIADLTLGFQAHVMVLAALAILIPARSFWPDHAGRLITGWALRIKGPKPGFPTALAGASVALTSLGLLWTSMAGSEQFWVAVVSLTILSFALTLWSVRAPALQDIALVPMAALVASVGIAGSGEVSVVYAATYLQTGEADFPWAVTLLWGIGLALSAVAAGRALRPGYGVIWALVAALAAPVVAVVLEMTWQPALTIGPYAWALHAMIMATFMVALTLRFARVDADDRTRISLFVLSALASISFALVLILSLAALTVALAVTVVVAAALDRRFDLPLMQLFIAVGVTAVGARLVGDPGLGWAFDAPFWELVLAYGGSLAAFVGALYLLGARARVTARVMLDTAAWSTGGILVSLLLIRILEDILPGKNTNSHWFAGLLAMIWLGLMLVQLIRIEGIGGTLKWIRIGLAAIFGLIGFGALLIGLTILSPLLSNWGDDVAGVAVLNTLIPAYLLPAVVLALGAWRLRSRRVRLGLLGISCALSIHWAFAALRHVWQGADGMELRNGFLQPELYSYTVAILVVGAALFYQSLARSSKMLRRAGLVVIGLAVAKVFLIDISGLEGLTRVLSLVVLGLSLAALAWLNRWAQTRDGPAPDNG